MTGFRSGSSSVRFQSVDFALSGCTCDYIRCMTYWAVAGEAFLSLKFSANNLKAQEQLCRHESQVHSRTQEPSSTCLLSFLRHSQWTIQEQNKRSPKAANKSCDIQSSVRIPDNQLHGTVKLLTAQAPANPASHSHSG